jgi:hypothetical protein
LTTSQRRSAEHSTSPDEGSRPTLAQTLREAIYALFHVKRRSPSSRSYAHGSLTLLTSPVALGTQPTTYELPVCSVSRETLRGVRARCRTPARSVRSHSSQLAVRACKKIAVGDGRVRIMNGQRSFSPQTPSVSACTPGSRRPVQCNSTEPSQRAPVSQTGCLCSDRAWSEADVARVTNFRPSSARRGVFHVKHEPLQRSSG